MFVDIPDFCPDCDVCWFLLDSPNLDLVGFLLLLDCGKASGTISFGLLTLLTFEGFFFVE